MRFDAPHARVQLPADQLMRLTHARGTRLRAITGTSWITIDNDPRDLVLQPGEEWVVDAEQPVLVTSLGGVATVAVCAPAQADSAAVLAARRAVGWVARHAGTWRHPAPAAAQIEA
jgi:hypothetical protein